MDAWPQVVGALADEHPLLSSFDGNAGHIRQRGATTIIALSPIGSVAFKVERGWKGDYILSKQH